MSGGHDEGHGEGLGAHLDRAGAAGTMAPFKPVSDTLWHTFAVKNSKRISEQENGVRCVERLREVIMVLHKTIAARCKARFK
jgi:hypothetical protein